ncbi:MAG: hypothetical protein NT040_04055 [Bacteroidetes bacterium]|nr:hypothetical protein [Bacteroidota bacterium]
MPTTNFFAKCYSGIFGYQVVLKSRGKKLIMTMPVKKSVARPTKKQLSWRWTFQHASRHATNLLKDPEVLASYRARVQKGQTAYNLALRDCLRAN